MAMQRPRARGVLKESKEQAKVIRNAARYLTGEAKAGSIMTTSNDNRRTYNQQSSDFLSRAAISTSTTGRTPTRWRWRSPA